MKKCRNIPSGDEIKLPFLLVNLFGFEFIQLITWYTFSNRNHETLRRGGVGGIYG